MLFTLKFWISLKNLQNKILDFAESAKCNKIKVSGDNVCVTHSVFIVKKDKLLLTKGIT